MQMTLKHFSGCLFYFCSTCADSITHEMVLGKSSILFPLYTTFHNNHTLYAKTLLNYYYILVTGTKYTKITKLPGSNAMTLSPTCQRLHPDPTASTTPAASRPRTSVSPAGGGYPPSLCHHSICNSAILY